MLTPSITVDVVVAFVQARCQALRAAGEVHHAQVLSDPGSEAGSRNLHCIEAAAAQCYGLLELSTLLAYAGHPADSLTAEGHVNALWFALLDWAHAGRLARLTALTGGAPTPPASSARAH